MKLSRNLLAVLAMAFVLVGAPALFPQGQEQIRKQAQHGITDANSDGICDVCGQLVGSGLRNAQGKEAKKGKHWGPADGSGNNGNGPKDGTGYGSQPSRRAGPQDGTGPYHQKGGQGQRAGGGRRGRS